jgi:hypothetical protein
MAESSVFANRPTPAAAGFSISANASRRHSWWFRTDVPACGPDGLPTPVVKLAGGRVVLNGWSMSGVRPAVCPPHRQRVGSAGRLDHREDACPTINLMDGKESQRDLPSSGSPCSDRRVRIGCYRSDFVKIASTWRSLPSPLRLMLYMSCRSNPLL